MKDGNKTGHYKPEKEFDPDTEIPPIQIKKINRKAIDLASGDYEREVTAEGKSVIYYILYLQRTTSNKDP